MHCCQEQQRQKQERNGRESILKVALATWLLLPWGRYIHS